MKLKEQHDLYLDWRRDKYYPRIRSIHSMGSFILKWDSGVLGKPCTEATIADRRALRGAAVVMFPELSEDLLLGMLEEVRIDQDREPPEVPVR